MDEDEDLSRFQLLPCPFCGGPVTMERCASTYERAHGQRKWYGVKCRNTIGYAASCAIQTVPSASPKAAANRWNMRNGKLPPDVPEIGFGNMAGGD